MAKRRQVGPPKTVPIDSVKQRHTPDKRGERTDKYGKQPIDVKRVSGGYKVIDGNDRLYYARQRGDRHIKVTVWERPSKPAPKLAPKPAPAKKRGFFYWE